MELGDLRDAMLSSVNSEKWHAACITTCPNIVFSNGYMTIAGKMEIH